MLQMYILSKGKYGAEVLFSILFFSFFFFNEVASTQVVSILNLWSRWFSPGEWNAEMQSAI